MLGLGLQKKFSCSTQERNVAGNVAARAWLNLGSFACFVHELSAPSLGVKKNKIKSIGIDNKLYNNKNSLLYYYYLITNNQNIFNIDFQSFNLGTSWPTQPYIQMTPGSGENSGNLLVLTEWEDWRDLIKEEST